MGVQRSMPSLSIAILLALALTAGAATVADVRGMVQLNGAAVSGDTAFPTGARLEVVGEGSAATIVTGAGDRLTLEPGSQVILNLVAEDKEVYELVSGAFVGTLSPKSVVMLPEDGRLEVPEGQAQIALESREGGTRTAIDVNEGKVHLLSGGQFKTALTSRQAAVVEFRKREPRSLAVSTGPDSEGNVTVFDQATPDLQIEVAFPKATTGRMASVEADTKTKIENDIDSSKEGRVGIISRVRGEQTATGEVAPGVFAYVLHQTGAIEFEYVEIDWEVLKRAIGLTTEFQTLAVSNFTGVLSPDPKSKSPKPEEPEEPYEPPTEETLRSR